MSGLPSIREQWNAPNFNRAAVALWGGFMVVVTHALAVLVAITEPGGWFFGLFFALIGWGSVAFIFTCESLGAAVSTTLKQWSQR